MLMRCHERTGLVVLCLWSSLRVGGHQLDALFVVLNEVDAASGVALAVVP